MSESWTRKCLILSFLALFFISEASRLPKAYNWEQMLPKKLPTPSSAPSRGTNSVTQSSNATKTDQKLPSSDGKTTSENRLEVWQNGFFLEDPTCGISRMQ
ncbi:hypothetical protein ACS0TY_027615 [Phlomoides rotata]